MASNHLGPSPGSDVRRGRFIAAVITPVALLLGAIRLGAMEANATSAVEHGRILGQVVVGPVLAGAVLWGLVAATHHGRGRHIRFLGPELLATVSIVEIVGALASIRA